MPINARKLGFVVLAAAAASGWLAHAQGDKKSAESNDKNAVAPAAAGQGVAEEDADERAIRESASRFVEAYNAHDAKALASLFAPKAEFIEEDGTLTKGREAIEQSFAELFAEHPDAVIEVEPDSIRILTPNIAVEEGVVRGIAEPEGDETVSSYLAVHVKVDGVWLVGSVRDFEAASEDRTPYDHLQELAWMIGDWIDESPDAVIHSTIHWNETENFVLHDFSAYVAGEMALSGTMRIGWDPLTQQFKSWVFDSAGGYTEGLWVRDGNEWIIKYQGATSDGESASSTSIYRQIDDDTIGWRSFNRVVAGELTEDVGEVIVKRKPPLPAE